MTDLAAIGERHVGIVCGSDGIVCCYEDAQPWPCDAAQLLALLADTPSVEPGETKEHDMACGRGSGVLDPLCAACRLPCKPRAHRYDRVGVTDVLRCRRCGWERAG